MTLILPFNSYVTVRLRRLFFYNYLLIPHIFFNHWMLLFFNNGSIGMQKLSTMLYVMVLANLIVKVFYLVLSLFEIKHSVSIISSRLFANVDFVHSDRLLYYDNFLPMKPSWKTKYNEDQMKNCRKQKNCLKFGTHQRHMIGYIGNRMLFKICYVLQLSPLIHQLVYAIV
jgi:hypothetical protein